MILKFPPFHKFYLAKSRKLWLVKELFSSWLDVLLWQNDSSGVPSYRTVKVNFSVLSSPWKPCAHKMNLTDQKMDLWWHELVHSMCCFGKLCFILNTGWWYSPVISHYETDYKNTTTTLWIKLLSILFATPMPYHANPS